MIIVVSNAVLYLCFVTLVSCSSQLADFATGVRLFFFQAEDGIRDLVRSRGLGDVYKRQDRELVSFLLQLSQKNELLSKVFNQIKAVKPTLTDKNLKQMQQLSAMIEENSTTPLDWNSVETQLEKIHPGFLGRLQAKHPVISIKDKKLCAYLRLGLSSKEISGLQNITSKSVEIARIRLRKKLKISGKIRLSNYLNQL